MWTPSLRSLFVLSIFWKSQAMPPSSAPVTTAMPPATAAVPTQACADDNTWIDSQYGDGTSHCNAGPLGGIIANKAWCYNHGAYSTEARRACPLACGLCTLQAPPAGTAMPLATSPTMVPPPTTTMQMQAECNPLCSSSAVKGGWESACKNHLCAGCPQCKAAKVLAEGGYEVELEGNCEGKQTVLTPCYNPDCNPCTPQDCVLSPWSAWSAPSDAALLGGFKCTSLCARKRDIQQLAKENGVLCSGNLVETKNCTEPGCLPVPRDCLFEEWSPWTPCTAPGAAPCTPDTAGTKRCLKPLQEVPATLQSTRQRKIAVQAEHGGRLCDGSMLEMKPCNTLKDDVCYFAPWSAWSPCVAPVNGSTHSTTMRGRAIQKRPSRLGTPCSGVLEEEKLCPATAVGAACVFGAWEAWSACDNSQNVEGDWKNLGQRSRTRSYQAATFGGDACDGKTEETQPCAPLPKIDCVASLWTEWTACTKDCGGGQQLRTRSVDTPQKQGGSCTFNTQETNPCNTQPCQTDCKLGQWSEWQVCPVTCGAGNRTRRRDWSTTKACVDDPNWIDSLHGDGSSHCNSGPLGGIINHTEWCHNRGAYSVEARRACPVACGVCTPGQAVPVTTSPCNDTQGGVAGKRCLKPMVMPAEDPAKANRINCGDADLEEIAPCQASLPCLSPACQWSEWTVTPCSVSCGEGFHEKTRKILSSSKDGGYCNQHNPITMVEKCNIAVCAVEVCANGTWDNWQEWTPCSMTCGTSYRSRKREALTQPDKCGYPALGPFTDYEPCTKTACSVDIDCTVSLWSEWSACTTTCAGIRKRERKMQEASGKGKDCGKTNMPLQEFQQCLQSKDESCGGTPPVVNCQLGAWPTAGGPCGAQCSKPCGGGFVVHKRNITVHAANGGKPCVGDLARVEACNNVSCANGECVDCAWGAWTAWDQCTSCEGQRTRRRDLIHQGNYCGLQCEPADAIQVADCRGVKAVCETAYQFCTWSEWSTESACPPTCGNHPVSRFRSLQKVVGVKPKSFLGMAKTLEPMKCEGRQETMHFCQNEKCPKFCYPQDCYPSEWSPWSEPGKEGLCARSRHIEQTNNECGKRCDGHLAQTKDCTKKKTDCQLGDWGTWSACNSNPCDEGEPAGQATRKRTIKVHASYKGAPCVDDLIATRPCNVDFKKPRNCSLSDWSEWNDCSLSCVGGMQKRKRLIKENSVYPGKPCADNMEQLRDCNSNVSCSAQSDCEYSVWSGWSSCVQNNQKMRSRTVSGGTINGAPCTRNPTMETKACAKIKIDCVVGIWTEWGSCDRTCGVGTKQRHRQVKQQPKKGGNKCPTALIEAAPCLHTECKARIDCEVTSWREWTYCTTTCGVGQKMRSRFVANNRTWIGMGCEKSLMQTRPCYNRVLCTHGSNCKWSDWMEWGACTRTCGQGGSRTRFRRITHPPEAGENMLQRMCPVKHDEVVEKCKLPECYDELPCIDGAWNDWQDWHACSGSCDDGYTMRQRTLKRDASHCGMPATGNSTEVATCMSRADTVANVSTQALCKIPVDCALTDWQVWGVCSASCDGVMERIRMVATYSVYGGMACKGALREVATCNPSQQTPFCPHTPPDKDCVIGEWTNFTLCSRSCDGGQTTRTRSVVVPKSGSGKPCDGSLQETKECNTVKCDPAQRTIDCTVGDWKEWGMCNRENFQRQRRRDIISHERYGGKQCYKMTLGETGHCPRSSITKNVCAWGDWGPLSACSASCGNGTQKRERKLMFFAADTDLSMDKAAGLYDDDDVLEQKVLQLQQEAANAKARHASEVAVAFFIGCGVLLAVLCISTSGRGTGKRSTRQVQSRSLEIEGTRSDATFELLKTDLAIVDLDSI